MIDPNKIYTVEEIAVLAGYGPIITREPNGTITIDATGGKS